MLFLRHNYLKTILFLISFTSFFIGMMAFTGFMPQANAASIVAIDSTSSPANGAMSWSHTIKAGQNRMLIVGGSGNITGVTFNGKPLTLMVNFKSTVNSASVVIYYLRESLMDAETTTGNIVVTGGKAGGAVSFINVDPTTPFQASYYAPTGYPNPNDPNSTNNGSQQDKVQYTAGQNGIAARMYGYSKSGQLAFSILTVVIESGSPPQDFTSGTTLWKTPSMNPFNSAAVMNAASPYTTSDWYIRTTTSGTYGYAGYVIGINSIAPIPTAAPTPIPTTPPNTYSISGNVFTDTNANGTHEMTESNFPSAPTMTISPNAGTIATNPNGSYTISNLPAGTYVVSYNSLPTGYHMTSPLTGSQPSFQVTVGPSCSTNGAPGASC